MREFLLLEQKKKIDVTSLLLLLRRATILYFIDFSTFHIIIVIRGSAVYTLV